ncbi:Cytochrome P450 [Penicillium manginii]|uniref:Cytochrome P450 n=1 Tax=Penicillium manginii TaxID=203109 RepID=UPI002548DA36|nr:Cytochrome P450 [Penicillium manginii]KAJ5749527.1 Cytochrome P450 [Penicillium manginii]
MVREYQVLGPEYASLDAVSEDLFQTMYTCPGVADSLNHVPVSALSKAVVWSRNRTSGKNSTYFQELVKEQEFGMIAELNIPPGVWCDFDCLPVALALMLRMIGRVLVGHPLCRDPDAISLFMRYGSAVPVSGNQISWLPRILRPLLGPHFAASRMQAELSGLIVEDMKHGADAKEDQMTLAQWVWEWTKRETPGEYTPFDVAGLLVSSIFGAVHTAGSVLTKCFYELTQRPELIEDLRNEVEQAIRDHEGVCRESIEAMTKLDSFIKETMRLQPVGPATVHRIIKKDFTFTNGLKLPKGTLVFAPNTQLHMDERYYDNPEEFDAFRFHKLGKQSDKPSNYKIAGSTPRTRQFGDGKHACPGKQLAADLLRLILAHFLLKFDIRKCDEDSSYPSLEQRRMSIKQRTPSPSVVV